MLCFSCLCFSGFWFSWPSLPPLLRGKRLSISTHAVANANLCAAAFHGLHDLDRKQKICGVARQGRWSLALSPKGEAAQKNTLAKTKGTGFCPPPVPSTALPGICPLRNLPLGNNWRRGFALADILRTTSDAEEGQHRGRPLARAFS